MAAATYDWVWNAHQTPARPAGDNPSLAIIPSVRRVHWRLVFVEQALILLLGGGLLTLVIRQERRRRAMA